MNEAPGQHEVIEVDSVEALQAVVRRAITEQRAIDDYGGAFRGFGNPPPSNALRLWRRPGADDGVIAHHVSDMTVRVRAGAELDAINERLAATGQFLPIDADRGLTIAEVINHHLYGSLRVGYGSVRDLLLGLGYVDGEGRDIRVGGRVVKNVAGLDVTRLFVGSMGELGLIHEATLRTYALPESTRYFNVKFRDARALSQGATAWLVSPARPASAELSSLGAARDGGSRWSLRVGYGGTPASIEAQVDALHTFVDGNLPDAVIEEAKHPAAGEHPALAERFSWLSAGSPLFKVVSTPSTLGDLCERLADCFRSLEEPGETLIRAFPWHGCLWALIQSYEEAEVEAVNQIIDDHVGKFGGFRMWQHGGFDRYRIERFAPPQPDDAVLCRIKRAMDPHGLFNPGRYLADGPDHAIGGTH